MKFRIAHAASLTLAFASSLAMASPSPDIAKPVAKGNWGATVTATEGGHMLGNPDAPVKLVEFMSYTCSHCAEFQRTGDGALKIAYVPTGKVSYEIRHLVRDPVDLTAALLTHCGDPKKFFGNHDAIMSRFDDWMTKARSTTQAQRSRWQFGTPAARFQAIASDLDFYEIMETRGYTRAQVDKCLTDEAKAEAIANTSRKDVETYQLKGTPSFLLNGKLLEGAHAWQPLQKVLDERL